MVDINKILKNIMTKGKVNIGVRQNKKALNRGKAKLVVIAQNCLHASEVATLAKKKKVPLYKYAKKGVDLGYACGKPFAVSVFTVLDAGGSDITQLVKNSKIK